MFVNMANGQRGLVCQYDVVCFDEVSGVSFDQKDGVNIMKGYMESGEFSRGRESIRSEGSIVLVGNFEVDVQHQQRIGTCSGRYHPKCATTPHSSTGYIRICPVGTFRRSMEACSPIASGWYRMFLPRPSRASVAGAFRRIAGTRTPWRCASGRDRNAVSKTVSGC